MKSMKRKLLVTILGVVFGVSILVLLITFWQLVTQKNSIRKIGHSEANTLSEETQETMERFHGQEAVGFSRSCAKYFNKTFASTRKNVQAVQGKIDSLYEESKTDTTADRNAGLVRGVSWNEVEEEFYLLAPVCDFISHLPGYNPQNLKHMDIYVVTDSGMCLDGTGKPLGSNYKDLRRTQWYKAVKRTKELYWSGIFYGKISGQKEIICAMPYFDREEKFRGCIVADMAVEEFQEIIDDFEEKQIVSVIFFDRSGELMYASNDYTKAEEAAKYLGKEDVVNLGEEIYSFRTLKETGWTICLVLDQKEIYEMIGGLREDIRANVEGIVDIVQESIRKIILFFLISIAVGCMLAVITANILAAGFVRPIRKLIFQAKEVGAGNLEQQIQIQSRDEIGQLARSFQEMQEELKDYMNNLQSMTADRERMEAEANVARQIQMNMLPNEFPAFPDSREFDIYAYTDPVDDDGGNFYDFFLADRTHLCIVLGEVGGGGIPATLFAVITMTHIQNYAKLGYRADRILMETNNQLSDRNDTGLTASVFLGIIDLETGLFEYVNAGQPVPLWKHSGREFEQIEAKSCFSLGNMENVPYWKQSLHLFQGDMIFMHTTGLSETADERGNIYTKEYLYESLKDTMRHHFELRDIAESIRKDLEKFSGGILQHKDSTLLLFRYFG